MAMSRSNFPTLLVEGLREVFGLGYAEQKLVYPRIFEIHKSKKKTETDQSVTGLGMLSAKDEGTPISYDDMIEGKRIALPKPQVINGENLSVIWRMATLNKQTKVVQLQRLNPVAA